MIRSTCLGLICILALLALVEGEEKLADGNQDDEDDSSPQSDERSIAPGAPIEENSAPEGASALSKQPRDSFRFFEAGQLQQPRTRPVVKQNIYNFYNYRTPTQENALDMTQPGQNYQPNYQPNYQSNYQTPNYNQYYGRPNYQTYPNYFQPAQQQPQQQQMPVAPGQGQQLQATDPTQPIGYMLINKYRSPFGGFTRPIAFFKTRR